MSGSESFSRTLRFLIGAACLGIALLVLREFAGFVNTLAIAAIFGIVFTPVLRWLSRKVPEWLALVLTLLLVLLIMVGLLAFFFYAATQLQAAIPVYTAEMEGLVASVDDLLLALGISAEANLFDYIEPTFLLDMISGFLSQFLSILSDTVVVFIILAFLLAGSKPFSAKTQRMVAERRNPMLGKLSQYSHDIRRYIVITNNLGMIAGVINAMFLLIIGVDFALVWGVLAWLLSYIPMVGFLLALIPPTILALLEFGWPTALLVAVGYIVINSVIDDVLKPRIMGDGLNLAPVMVFVSVVFWGLILGPLGSILAVPVTVAIKVLALETDPHNSWMAELMSAEAEEAQVDD